MVKLLIKIYSYLLLLQQFFRCENPFTDVFKSNSYVLLEISLNGFELGLRTANFKFYF